MSINKIKILEIIDEAKIGGGQKHLLLLVKYLDKNKFDILVACESEGYLVEELKKIDIPVINVSLTNRLRLSNFLQMFSIYKKYKFDVVHTHGGTAGFWGRFAALFLRKKPILIHTFHGIHYLNFNHIKRYFYILIDFLLNTITNKNIFVCESDYKKGIKFKISSPRKAVIIRNGIELDEYIKNVDRIHIRSKFSFQNYFIYGNVGRLHKQKGHKYLIEAFAELSKKYNDIRLAIVGDGELDKILKKLTEDLNVSNKVLFLGSQSDVINFLHSIDVFVLPSLWEGQPLTIFEAMATAKPIIATAVDGINEILEHGLNALLCPPMDVKALHDAMELLYKDRNLADKISTEAKKSIINKHLAQNTANEISDLYETLYNKLKI